MNAARTTRPLFISLLGLVAVLLGALEHESLLFQPDIAVETRPMSDAIASDSDTGYNAPRIENYPHESGTEGTFRSESHSLGLLAGLQTAQVQPRHQRPLQRNARVTSPPTRRPDRAPTDGVLDLRL